MADEKNVLDPSVEVLDGDYQPGGTIQHRHESLQGLGARLKKATTKTHMFESGAIPINSSIKKVFIAPQNLRITQIDAVKNNNVGAGSDCTAPMLVGGARNPIDGIIDIHALANPDEPEKQLLSGSAVSLVVNKGESVTCEFTTDGSTTLAEGAAVAMHYEVLE